MHRLLKNCAISTIVAATFITCYLFAPHCAAHAQTPQQLLPQQIVKGELKGGETHTYLIKLQRGDFLHVVLEQHDIDLVVSLRNRAGVELVETNLFGERGPEPISYHATATGEYLLEVRPGSDRALKGGYSITSSVTNLITTADQNRATAERLLNEAEKLYGKGRAIELGQAAAKTNRSLLIWRQLNDRYWVAFSLNMLGLIHKDLGAHQKALDYYNQALSLRRAIGDRRGEAATLENIGEVYNSTRQKDLALDFFKQALAIHHATGNRILECELLNYVGNINTAPADLQKALEFYNAALPICRGLGDRVATASVLNNLGRTYFLLKERDKVPGYYLESLSLNEAGGDDGHQIVFLTNAGDFYMDLDKHKALDYYNQALKISRTLGDREQEFQTIVRIGAAYNNLGQPEKAIDWYKQAITTFQRAEDRLREGDLLLEIAFIRNSSGHREEAVRDYKKALALFSVAKERVEEAEALKSIADVLATYDRKSAIDYYLKLLRLQRNSGDRYAEALTLENIGFLFDDIGDFQKSLDFLNRAHDVFTSLRKVQEAANELINIGNVYYSQERKAKALEYYEKALSIHRSIKNRAGEASALTNIGLVYDQTNEMEKALEYYGQALRISQEIADKNQEADILINMGLIYADLGNHAKALTHYEGALKIRRELKDRRGEANALINSGVSYLATNKPSEALSLFQQALKIRQIESDKYGQANALTKIGETFVALGQKREALDHFEQARTLYRVLNEPNDEVELLITMTVLEMSLDQPAQALVYARQGQSVVRAARLKNLDAVFELFLGGAYVQLKQLEPALAHLNKAESVFRADNDPRGQGMALLFLGVAYYESNQLIDALSTFQKALPYIRSAGNRKLEAELIKNIAELYEKLGRRDEALNSYSQSLALYRTENLPAEEATVLLAIGIIYEAQGDKEKAAGYYAQALFRNPELFKRPADGPALNSKGGTYDSLGVRKEQREHLAHYLESYQHARIKGLTGIEAEALSRAMGVLKEQAPELAIIFGKQAATKYLEVRSNPGQYGMRLANDTYMRSFPSTCRDLADLLIEKGRLYEAEQVMALLKEEEYLEYVRRDATEVAALSERPELRPKERKLFVDYTQLFDRVTLIGSRRAELIAKEAGLSDAEKTELKQLNRDIAIANEAFSLFMNHIKSDFGPTQYKEIVQNRGLQSDLRNWGNGTVMLHTLVGPKRYRIILTTPQGQVDRKTEITAAELNKKVAAFRQTLMNPQVDPLPQARELYDILIRPIESDLRNANARTLIWSLDGALRYLPLAALHDGDHYMVERYQQVIITLASRTRLSDQVSKNWRGLGLGVSAQWGSFSALPAVIEELESIIRDERTANAVKDGPEGVLPGLRLVDKEFTAQTFTDALGRKFSFIHIASHFSLAPGDAEKSFLLLGDGNRLSLKTIDAAPEYDLTGVELLTLSSCNTGVNGSDEGEGPNGDEVENFGLIAQNRGAKAVIATLWSVADDSTGVLMREFYRVRSTTSDITKAEALQRAQLALLHGDPEVVSAGSRARRADLVGADGPKPGETSRFEQAGKPYAHPYYWAPFILIGNWR